MRNKKMYIDPNYKIKNQIHSGTLNEINFVKLIKNYTNDIYRNKRFYTYLTDSNSTEIDIIFFYQNSIFIVEAKNVISLNGKLYHRNWQFKSKTMSYIALNPIVQNKIHVRSFKNNFFQLYGYYPNVQSFVVVPNNTSYDENLKNEILTLTDFDNYLFNYINQSNINIYLRYQLKRMF